MLAFDLSFLTETKQYSPLMFMEVVLDLQVHRITFLQWNTLREITDLLRLNMLRIRDAVGNASTVHAHLTFSPHAVTVTVTSFCFAVFGDRIAYHFAALEDLCSESSVMHVTTSTKYYALLGRLPRDRTLLEDVVQWLLVIGNIWSAKGIYRADLAASTRSNTHEYGLALSVVRLWALEELISYCDPSPFFFVLHVHELCCENEVVILGDAIARFDGRVDQTITTSCSLIAGHEHRFDRAGAAVWLNHFRASVEDRDVVEPGLWFLCQDVVLIKKMGVRNLTYAVLYARRRTIFIFQIST
jgi:hypothetical protein